MATEWTELAYLEIQAGNTAMIVFGFAVVMVFLVLAAQYESWSLPLAVILVVPMCSPRLDHRRPIHRRGHQHFYADRIRGAGGTGQQECDPHRRILEGVARAGETPREATLQACRLRLRPIVMTSLAFILGVVPLITSNGAGAEMRRILGTTVFSGMIGVTIFGIFLTPVFFYVIDRLSGSRLFHLRWVERVSDALLGILSLRFLRRLGRRPKPIVVGLPSTNGHRSNGLFSDSAQAGIPGAGHDHAGHVESGRASMQRRLWWIRWGMALPLRPSSHRPTKRPRTGMRRRRPRTARNTPAARSRGH